MSSSFIFSLLKTWVNSAPKFCQSSKLMCKAYCTDSIPRMKSILNLEHYVKPSGTLKVSLPYAVQIVTADPEVNPMMDKIVVEVHGVGTNNIEDNDIQQLCRIENNDDYILLSCNDNVQFDKHQVSCRIDVPIKYNLEVNTKNHSDVCLESIECSHCLVSTQQGSIICSKLKTDNLQAKTAGGHILCSGTVLGDIYLDAQKKGSIQAEKLQGNVVTVRTEQGSVNIKSIYAEKTQIMNQNGNVKLSNVHGNTDVIMKNGNLNIQGADGNLNVRAENAEVSVHVSQLNNVSIETDSGNIDVSLPEKTSTKVQLEGSSVNVCDELNFTGETGPLLKQWTGKLGHGDETKGQLHVVTENGYISVKMQDWFSSLNLVPTNPEKE